MNREKEIAKKVDMMALENMAMGLLGLKDEPQTVEVWEVYKRDSQEYIMFKTEELARDQTYFSEVDLIGKANVNLTKNEMQRLNEGKPVFG